MATYTASLSRLYPDLATYYNTAVQWSTDGHLYGGEWIPAFITTPVWKSGAKTFYGYYSGADIYIADSGMVVGYDLRSNISLTESWYGSPIAVIKDGSTIVGEYAYDGGVWYQDFKNKIVLSKTEKLTKLPSKTNYKFLGIFSTNATSGGTKYVDENGYATTALMNLAPTSDKTFYLRFELATKTITIESTNGTWEYKKFYQRIEDNVYTRYSRGTTEISEIPLPTRECFRWNGARKTSTSTSTLYINPNGTFTSSFLSRTAANATIYGNFWTRTGYKITLDANGGSVDTSAYYIVSGTIVPHWLDSTSQAISIMPIPSRKGYRFLGYFDATSGGTKYVYSSGRIDDTLKALTKNITLYAHWRKASAKITLDANGGVGGTSYIYADDIDGVYFDSNSQPITSISDLPTYSGNVFNGFYSDQVEGSYTVYADGSIIAITPSSDETWYAHWIIGKSRIHVDANGGQGGTEIFYCDIATNKFYSDEYMTHQIQYIELPTKHLYRPRGAFDASGTGVIWSTGYIPGSYQPTAEDEYITVEYTRRCYEITLDPVGGTADKMAVYYDTTGGTEWYQDEYLTIPMTPIQSNKIGHTIVGYYYNGTKVIAQDGHVMDIARQYQDDYTAEARWTPNVYTITFNPAGGTIPYTSKSVQYGAQIGQIPTPSWKNHKFLGWSIDNVDIDTTTVYSWGSDKTAKALWEQAWGYTQDYWGLGSSTLVPIKSDDGAKGEMIHTADGSAQYQIVLHPSVTYMVIGQTDLRATLGDVGKGSYTITQVTVDTRLATPPTVTVSGVASEGQRSINTYPVRIIISPRHRAQILDDAIRGGGEIQSCTYTAKCDPVVVYGTGSDGKIVPIASDVVHGLAVVQAQTAAYNMESAPTASNGYTSTEVSEDGDHIGYKTFNISVEKEI